ncbi:MAG: DUF488 domain-containing protein [Thermoguttaceae bacterium]|nr:DUF488 domain-containing protein [Thermoguttaceae bacterium]
MEDEIYPVLTMGYEGKTISDFIRQLCSKEVEAVLDVRVNPISRKPGFSKAALEERLKEVGIKYFAFPRLGIPSFYRQQYPIRQELLDFYERELLPNVPDEIARAAKVCREYRSVLLCFEADPNECHRSRLVNWIINTERPQQPHEGPRSPV